MIRVDLTTDEGVNWSQAELKAKPPAPHGRDYSWTLWEARVPVPPTAAKNSQVVVAARATDDSYNSQPERVGPIWNMRGVLNNAWSRVSVKMQ